MQRITASPLVRPLALGELEGIGELVEHGLTWQLTYAACGHVQQLARFGLEEPDRAVRDVRRHYARCLLCPRGL